MLKNVSAILFITALMIFPTVARERTILDLYPNAPLCTTPPATRVQGDAPRSGNVTPLPRFRPLIKGKCVDKPGLVKGQDGYNHCRDHELFPKVFNVANCSCSVGQCRETEWRSDAKSPSGVVFKIVDGDGAEHWCPVDNFIDMRKIAVPPELDGEAYVCVEDGATILPNGCPATEDMNCNLRRDGM